MKFLIYSILLGLTPYLFAQDQKTVDSNLDQFNELINYTPTTFKPDTSSLPERDELFSGNINIINLNLRYELLQAINPTFNELAWLKNNTEQLALSFYLEGTNIMIKNISSQAFENDGIDTVKLRNQEIIIVQMPHTCIVTDGIDDFQKYFNETMFELMNIPMPNHHSWNFEGEFEHQSKKHPYQQLSIHKGETFDFITILSPTDTIAISGFWHLQSNQLTLYPESKNKNSQRKEDTNSPLVFRMKKDQLIPQNHQYRNLKSRISIF